MKLGSFISSAGKAGAWAAAQVYGGTGLARKTVPGNEWDNASPDKPAPLAYNAKRHTSAKYKMWQSDIITKK